MTWEIQDSELSPFGGTYIILEREDQLEHAKKRQLP